MNTVRGTAAELDDHPVHTTGARLGDAACTPSVARGTRG